MGRFDGKYIVNNNNGNMEPFDMVRELTTDLGWFNVLKKTVNVHYARTANDGIFIGKKEGDDQYVCPEVFRSTDDCDCCS
jgi:hypothetical protein